MNLNEKNENIINQLINKSIDFHCHGVGRFDFTEIQEINLQEIENILTERKQRVILTLYLRKQNFEKFLYLMEDFYNAKLQGKFTNIMGFGLEGPLLASHGGTPEEGVWLPTKQHWRELAKCGHKGLIYNIFSPDAHLPGSNFVSDTNLPKVTWITEILLEGGVLPAPGHFVKSDPNASAKALQSLFDVVEAWGHGATITDHLYNDMPHNFKHAWRTYKEKQTRDQDIQSLNIESWKLNNLEEKLGIVPAIMIKNAKKGLVKICQNFDGEHVDLAIIKKTVELVGAENMLMMTDSIESKRLGGRNLHMHEGSTLLYQDEDIVAAGSQNVQHQIENMFAIGLSKDQIELMTNKVPSSTLQHRLNYIENMVHA